MKEVAYIIDRGMYSDMKTIKYLFEKLIIPVSIIITAIIVALILKDAILLAAERIGMDIFTKPIR